MSIRLCGIMLAIFTFLGNLLWTADGYAQPADPTNDCDHYPPCAEMAEQGRTAAADGLYHLALHAYRVAYSLKQSPMLLYNLARVLHKAGQLSEAVSHYRQ